MNNSLVVKSLIGLATTGAIAGGVAWATWPNSSVGKEESEMLEHQALKESLGIRTGKRIGSLAKAFVSVERPQKIEIVKIVSRNRYGESALNSVFYVNEGTNQFHDPSLVGTEVDAWCKSNNDSSTLPSLDKRAICDQ